VSPAAERRASHARALSGREALAARFASLDALLAETADLWRPTPFRDRRPPWRGTHPQLTRWLARRSAAEVSRLSGDPEALVAALARHVPALAALPELTAVPPRRHGLPAQPPPRFHEGIPQRKWAQVRAFAAALTPRGASWLDWCAGKAHLARTLAWLHPRPTTSLERDPRLSRTAAELAERHAIPLASVTGDALTAPGAELIDRETHVVALHACGALHRRLLQLAAERRPAALSLSPCCYHREDAMTGPGPFSRRAAHARLTPHPDALRLAVQETVTAAPRQTRLRHREQAWRLAFDLLQRELRGCARYQPLPPVPKALLRDDFPAFCRWAAGVRARDASLPGDAALARRERAGWCELARVRRLELVRQAFRRALELWLVLDRALSLAEAGFDVEVTTFCERTLTPRNLLIDACRGQARSAAAHAPLVHAATLRQ